MTYRVMYVGSMLDSPIKICDWLNEFTEKNNVKLIAVDNGLFFFEKIEQQT